MGMPPPHTLEVLRDIPEVGDGVLVDLDQPLVVAPALVAQLLHLEEQVPLEILWLPLGRPTIFELGNIRLLAS